MPIKRAKKDGVAGDGLGLLMQSVARVFLGLFLATVTSWGYAQQEADRDSSLLVEEVTITGSRLSEPPGSSHLLDEEVLERWGKGNIQESLRSVPGFNIQIEDGYGLRPNIGIRGVQTERSSRITLLEDGVLIAPAPYSAPSAYYFPTQGRLHAIEAVKGSASITQGPYTIGGALNFISTPIPAESTGEVAASLGDRLIPRYMPPMAVRPVMVLAIWQRHTIGKMKVIRR